MHNDIAIAIQCCCCCRGAAAQLIELGGNNSISRRCRHFSLLFFCDWANQLVPLQQQQPATFLFYSFLWYWWYYSRAKTQVLNNERLEMGFHALLMGHLYNGALDVLFNISTAPLVDWDLCQLPTATLHQRRLMINKEMIQVLFFSLFGRHLHG